MPVPPTHGLGRHHVGRRFSGRFPTGHYVSGFLCYQAAVVALRRGTCSSSGRDAELYKEPFQEPTLDDDLKLISDGDGLAVIRSPTAETLT